jgi:hypothetical protein
LFYEPDPVVAVAQFKLVSDCENVIGEVGSIIFMARGYFWAGPEVVRNSWVKSPEENCQ